ncbi:hypothetical protein RvY_15004 [Ramazzottius varieornatus]|uniref:Uncharacterized protein n=1 Tax=Ramazzottius varieornatus TaxID=947166 RepID=A0A1D1VY82_RAMVA|nr:hypothetical protein RvY_15004 [Ramazzottius varieornatus]
MFSSSAVSLFATKVTYSSNRRNLQYLGCTNGVNWEPFVRLTAVLLSGVDRSRFLFLFGSRFVGQRLLREEDEEQADGTWEMNAAPIQPSPSLATATTWSAVERVPPPPGVESNCGCLPGFVADGNEHCVIRLDCRKKVGECTRRNPQYICSATTGSYVCPPRTRSNAAGTGCDDRDCGTAVMTGGNGANIPSGTSLVCQTGRCTCPSGTRYRLSTGSTAICATTVSSAVCDPMDIS